MGYYIFSYGIKTTEIKKVFNSKDFNLLSDIKENEVFQDYSDFQPSNFTTTPAKALKDIINGNTFDVKSNYAYGYALIGICGTVGINLPYNQEIKLGYETDFINKALSEDFNVDDFNIEEILFKDNSNPFPIPPIDDWPAIGLLTLDELVGLNGKMKHIHITEEIIEKLSNSNEEDDEEKAFAYEHLRGLIENFDFCIKNELDLISFCH